MSSLVSVAGSSIQLVLNAYYLVKTNRDRCHKLVERCESLVAMLQQVVDQRGEDIYDRDRIERLQEAFEHIAIVIVQVGTRSWMQAYLQSDGDNVILEGCHRRISDLISLFNLRELIDVGNNQAAHNRAQVAVSKQNEEELSRLKSVNGDIVRQLKAQQYLLKKLAKKLSLSTVDTEGDVGPQEMSLPASSIPELIPQPPTAITPASPNPEARSIREGSTVNWKRKSRSWSTASVVSSATPSSTTSSCFAGGDPHKKSVYRPPSSDLSIRAEYGSEIRSDAQGYPAQVTRAAQATPKPQPKLLSDYPPDEVLLSPSLPVGTAQLSGDASDLPGEVEVHFIPEVTESGVLIGQAGLLGRTNVNTLRSWTDTPELVSQTIRPEPGTIVLRLLPTADPYLILPSPLLKPASNFPTSPSPSGSGSTPLNGKCPPPQPSSNPFLHRVYLIKSHAPILLALLTHHGNTIHRALFPWSPDGTVRQLKGKLIHLLRRTTSASPSPSRTSSPRRLFRSLSHHSPRSHGVEVDPESIRFAVVGSLCSGTLKGSEKLGSTELADGGDKQTGDTVGLVPGRYLRAEVSSKH